MRKEKTSIKKGGDLRLISVGVMTLAGLTLGTEKVMAQPSFPDKSLWYISLTGHTSITGLDNFSLIGPAAVGTYSGSDVFKVVTTNPTGAAVRGSISAFTPPLVNQAFVTVVPEGVPRGATDCEVFVNVDVVLLDAPGTHQATLTITATENL